MQKQQRPLGTMPLWATTGPVTWKNYHYRAEGYCARKSSERSGQHPEIGNQSPELADWIRYFDWLGGQPFLFARMIEWPTVGHTFTVPELQPEWFDPDYADAIAASQARG